MNPMRFRLISFLALFLALWPAAAHCETYQNWPEDTLLGSGTALLQAGQKLEKAIAMFTVLTERKPDDANYRMLLGCACASRLASFAHAAENAEAEEQGRFVFQKRLKIWRQMQDNPAMPLYRTPQPVSPASPATPDDSQPFDPRDKNTQKRIEALVTQTLQSLRQAYRLSRSLDPERRAPISYACGWSFLLLYRSAKDEIEFQEKPDETSGAPSAQKAATSGASAQKVKQKTGILTHDEIIACFQDCLDCDKKRADYWQSFAYANAPDYLANPDRADAERKIAASKTTRIAPVIDSLHRALKIKRNDPDTLYELTMLAYFAAPDETLDSLKKLAVAQDRNATNFYLLAAAQLEKARRLDGAAASKAQDAALTVLESGNAAPQYETKPFAFPAPKILRTAWSYQATYCMGTELIYQSSLFELLINLGNQSIKSNTNDTVMRVGVDMTAMGMKSLQRYEGRDIESNDLWGQVSLYYRAFYGFFFGMEASDFIRTAAKASPTEANTALLNQYAPLKPYWKAWYDALIKE